MTGFSQVPHQKGEKDALKARFSVLQRGLSSMGTCRILATSRGSATPRFLNLLRQLLYCLDRHAFDIHHLATQPSPKPDC